MSVEHLIEKLKTTNEGRDNPGTVAVLEALAADVEKLKKSAAGKAKK